MPRNHVAWFDGASSNTGDPELASKLFCPVCHRQLRWALATSMWVCPAPDCLFPEGPEPDDVEVTRSEMRQYVTDLWAQEWDTADDED